MAGYERKKIYIVHRLGMEVRTSTADASTVVVIHRVQYKWPQKEVRAPRWSCAQSKAIH